MSPSRIVDGGRFGAARVVLAALCCAALLALAAAPAPAQDMERLTRDTFADLAEKTKDAVVAVELVKFQPYARRASNTRPRGGNSDSSAGGGADGYYQTHSGSGVLVSDDGVIVTCHHIVAARSSERDILRVRLPSGSVFEGDQVEVLGVDKYTDTAVLRLAGDGHPHLRWSDSRSIRIGEWVMVIGNPLDFDFSVSQGIVSGLHRVIDSPEIAIEDLIQTTAVINRGSSGGALVDLDGNLVGVVTAIATTSDLWQGLGFVMPQHILQPVVDSIVRDGFARRGYLGITMEPVKRVDPGAKAARGRDSYEGVLVTDVLADYPAMNAGVRSGDVIVAIDGSAVRANDDIFRLVGTRAPGEFVRLDVLREGGVERLDVELAERPEEGEIATRIRQAVARPRGAAFLPPRLMAPAQEAELASAERGEDLLERLGVAAAPRHDGALGLIVLRVRDGSPAGRAGVEEGDVLLEVDGSVARGMADCRQKLARTIDEGSFGLHVQRGDDPLDLRVDWKPARRR